MSLLTEEDIAPLRASVDALRNNFDAMMRRTGSPTTTRREARRKALSAFADQCESIVGIDRPSGDGFSAQVAAMLAAGEFSAPQLQAAFGNSIRPMDHSRDATLVDVALAYLEMNQPGILQAVRRVGDVQYWKATCETLRSAIRYCCLFANEPAPSSM